jgi:uncharacterized protein (DUF1330 family)
MTDALDVEIQAYHKMGPELIKHHQGKFIIIHNQKLEGAYDNFDSAAEEAIKRFGRGPYLIRQVGEPSNVKIPASVAYRITHASH